MNNETNNLPGGASSRVSTGVSGLDEVLHGGLPGPHFYLVEGDPGTGKTTLALQFALAGIQSGDRCLYLALSETPEELHAIAGSHGWSLDALDIVELVPAEASLKTEDQYSFFHPEEIELSRTVTTILEKIEEMNPARLVVDSLAELRLLAHDPRRYRRQVLALKNALVRRNAAVIILDDRTSRDHERQLHSVVHGVISLERVTREYGKYRRRLEVAKMRGSDFVEGYHDYDIHRGGIVVFPRIHSISRRADAEPGVISSGVAEIDSLLGGGLDRGSSTLLVGPAGSGKTTLAMKFAAAAMRRAEPVAVYTFDESIKTLLVRCDGLDLPLRTLVDERRVTIEQVDPAEMSPGEFVHRVRQSVEAGAQMVVIDSLNGFLAAMPEEQFLTLQMHELLTYLNQRNVVTVLVLAQQGVFGSAPPGVEVSYLADTIVLLRFFEVDGTVRRAISVTKKRSTHHEQTIRELSIGPPHGIQAGEPLRGFRGVLTGVPEYVGQQGNLFAGSGEEQPPKR
jgi:circadian clock protein KaiC